MAAIGAYASDGTANSSGLALASPKRLCILDLTERNGEEDQGNIYSATHALDVAGIPYCLTQDLDSAMANAGMIVLGNPVHAQKSFTHSQWASIKDWVCSGGILVAPCIANSDNTAVQELFGISGLKTQKETGLVTWAAEKYPELAYFDQPEEKAISLSTVSANTIYHISTASPLGYYGKEGDKGIAAVKNSLGRGAAYALCASWRNMILRAQLDKHGSSRSTNNGYEPTSDMMPLLLRGIYAAHEPVAVWKHTIPNGKKSAVILTHDCDSRTAMDSLFYMADYEHSIGARSIFNITAHYFRDAPYMSCFFSDETIPALCRAIAQGHSIGSHSICHFPDFNRTDLYPMTVTTPEEYASTAHYDIAQKRGIGGSTWAEIVLSKQLLEEALGAPVRAFRSGHLCVNKHFPAALAQGEYAFSSCYYGGAVMTYFPFFWHEDIAWRGSNTQVLEIPLGCSDVFKAEPMSEKNWSQKPEIWHRIYTKLEGNYAPCVVLIHPNRKWKMLAEKQFIEMLDLQDTELANFEDYGDFWLCRQALDYHWSYSAQELTIRFKNLPSDYAGQGLVIETLPDLAKINVFSPDGRSISYRTSALSPTRLALILE